MRFITNRIPTNKSGSFSALVEKVAAGNGQVKTASAEEDVTVAQTTEAANDDNETRTDVHHGEGSANDQNGEPEHDGENKTVEPEGLKAASEETEVKEASDDTEEEEVVEAAADSEEEETTEAASDTEEEEVVEATADGETKVASDEGESGGDKGDGPGDGEDQDGVNTGRFPEPDREDADCYTQEADDEGKADVESSAKTEVREAIAAARLGNVTKLANLSDEGRKLFTVAFEKTANLKPKQKEWLKNYYRMVWPEEYSESLVQDK